MQPDEMGCCRLQKQPTQPDPRGLRRWHGLPLQALLLLVASFSCLPSGLSEEPVRRFLERLREESLYDLADLYLADLAAKNQLPSKLKADLPLERLLLQYDSAALLRSLDQRTKKLDLVESGLKDFVANNPNHERRSEARLRLANILLNRAKASLDRAQSSKGSAADRNDARTSYEASRSLFDEIMKELQPILQQMQGARIDADDADKLALRDRYMDQYREAEILKALCARFIGDSFEPQSADAKKWLETAEEELSNIYKKSSAQDGRRILCLLYRGEIQSILGKVDEANESLQRVATIEKDGIFRTWRAQALKHLVLLLATPQQQKHEAILNQADEVLKTMSKSERNETAWLDLQLAVAEAKLDWAKLLGEQANGSGRAKAKRNDARGVLQNLARKPSPVQDKAKQLLADLGVESDSPKEPEGLPEIKKFAEGMTAANERLAKVDGSLAAIELLTTRRKEVPPAEQAGIDAELAKIQEENQRLAREAERLLTQTLRLFGKEDSRDDLHKARNLLAFSLLKQEKYWEAASLSDYVARTSSPPTSLLASRFARASYAQLMLPTIEPAQQPDVADQFESLVTFLLRAFPDAPESHDAALVLVNQALQNQQWDKAEQYASLVPESNEKGAMIRRELGIVLYRRYLIAADELRKQGKQPGEMEAALLERAIASLQIAVEGINPSQANQRSVEAGNCLAGAFLKKGDAEKGRVILERANSGPLALIQANQFPVDSAVRLESYRLRMQAMLLATTSSGAAIDPSQVEKVLKDMATIAKETPEGAGRMTGPLIQLTQDLRSQIDQSKAPGEKAKLTKSTLILLQQLGSVSPDINVQEWAASSLIELAVGDAVPDPTVSQEMGKYASTLYDRLAALEEEKPGSLAAANKNADDVMTRHATAYRLSGNPEAAIDKLKLVLDHNPANPLLAQIELARSYQALGMINKNGSQLKLATLGEGKFWGWNKLSQRMNQNEKLFKYFCESRYQIAECFYQAGLLNGSDKGKADIEKAKTAIRSTFQSTSKLSESPWYPRMEDLLRRIQKELNQAQVGFQEFTSKS